MKQAIKSFQNIAGFNPCHLVVNWTGKYEANELPTEATPAWAGGGQIGAAEISPAGYLHLETEAEQSKFYQLNVSDFDASIGLTAETRLKVISSNGTDIQVRIDDLTNSIILKIHESGVQLTQVTDEEEATYAMDTTDDYHIYRITKINQTVKVYVDGVLRLTGTANVEGEEGFVSFGAFGPSEGQESSWDYFYYRTDGAFAP